MKKIGRREFLSDKGLSMVAYSCSVNDNNLLKMYFTIYLNKTDVTLHREVSLKEYPLRELNIESAFNKIERLIKTLQEYVKHLQDGGVVNDHRPVGLLVEPDTGDYVGETSTVHLWANGDQVSFSLTSCEKKLRTTLDREPTIELLTTLIGHLWCHLNDAKTITQKALK
ncbi:hypothetical protein FDJ25_gp124 [Vibrio phage Aphrodite1]|uniref:Uncharacterized protein n=1 Tax=Vibrio phage Aphrodite1 TaxID=2070057 RepID=A0A2I7QI18_9CAUD|nr:hypothetical protein FDJ25_gp124 [Vibrio phage Aphrodite1]AUR81042.1 hypothetical protein Aphrodite1_0078 [Vibrio phage Aphrodite1]